MANTVSTNLFKYLGMVGSSGMRTGSLVPRSNTPNSGQELFRDFSEAGKTADPDVWTKFNSYTKKPTTFDAMLQLWEEMAGWDLMAAALVEIVDEATQTDQNSPATLWYQCNDRDFEDELNGMAVNINIEEILPSQVWHVAGLGNHFEKIEYAPNEGVMGLSFVHPLDVRRYWLERNRKCVGFRWSNHHPSKEAAFVHPDNKTPIERVSLNDGNNLEELWYPWDFLHFRRMFRLRISEHGEPLFAEADGIYKKLRMAVDQMVVHRAQVQPDRYVINVDTKDQAPMEQMKTVQRWKQMLRSKLAFGGGSGAGGDGMNDPSGFQSFYNAWSLDTILWMAKPNGFEHVVEKLPGTATVPDVYDIELLTDLFYAIIGMPRSWFGAKSGDGGGGGEQASSGKALLAQDMRFLRKIKSIRRPIINQYTWLGYFHAILKGKDIRQLDIKAMMSPIGSLEDQMKLEMLRQQAEVLDLLADVMQKYNLPKEAWVETIFKRYMHLPDEVVNIFLTSLPAEIEQPMESKKRTDAPYTYKLIREIEEALGGVPGATDKIRALKESIQGNNEVATCINTRKVFESTFSMPKLNDFDVLVSSYGRSPFEVRGSSEGKQSGYPKNQPLMESTTAAENAEPAYRKFMPEKM